MSKKQSNCMSRTSVTLPIANANTLKFAFAIGKVTLVLLVQ